MAIYGYTALIIPYSLKTDRFVSPNHQNLVLKLKRSRPKTETKSLDIGTKSP